MNENNNSLIDTIAVPVSSGEILSAGNEIGSEGKAANNEISDKEKLPTPDEQAAQISAQAAILEPINSTAEPVKPENLIEKRGRGRPKGTKNKKDNSTDPNYQPGQPEFFETNDVIAENLINDTVTDTATASQPATDYKALAGLTVDMSTASLSVAFGNEWQPENEQEREALVMALEKYFASRQVQDIPPGALLALVVTTYAAKRFRQPSTANKLKAGWYWLKSKFSKKKKFQPEIVKENK